MKIETMKPTDKINYYLLMACFFTDEIDYIKRRGYSWPDVKELVGECTAQLLRLSIRIEKLKTATI